nr:hypothetical protein [Tanacetum cinerariifolium]
MLLQPSPRLTHTQLSLTITTPPPKTQPNIIMPSPNNKGQLHTPKPKNPMGKFLRVSISYMDKIQNDFDALTRVPPPPLIEKLLSIVHCANTFFSSLQGYPQKFVFLQNKLEPPWKQHDMRSKAMSLEDKTRFEAWGIVTCKNSKRVKTKSMCLSCTF